MLAGGGGARLARCKIKLCWTLTLRVLSSSADQSDMCTVYSQGNIPLQTPTPPTGLDSQQRGYGVQHGIICLGTAESRSSVLAPQKGNGLRSGLRTELSKSSSRWVGGDREKAAEGSGQAGQGRAQGGDAARLKPCNSQGKLLF